MMDGQQEVRKTASSFFPQLEQRGVGRVGFIALLTSNDALSKNGNCSPEQAILDSEAADRVLPVQR